MTHKYSFYIILTLVFLLPLFFIPGALIPLSTAKAALAVLGVVALALVFFYEIWKAGNVSFPRHYLLVVAALLPAVYFLSAILATPSSLALLGYNLEQGTFGFILLGSSLLLLASVVFSDPSNPSLDETRGKSGQGSRVLQALTVFFISLSLLAIFAALKILVGGNFLALGNFFGNMGNPLGSWTDLAMVFGLLAAFSALTLGMLPLALPARVLLYAVFTLSTALLVVINFSTAFAITLVASVLLWLYFAKVEPPFAQGSGGVTPRRQGSAGQERGKIVLPIILAAVSLVFLINPTVSETRGNLGNVVSSTFGVENADVRPSLSATLSVSKQVLSLSSFLGSGPNTFGQDWLIYRPLEVNTTPFWSVAFPFGIGFLPTQIATTGILGSAFWLIFIVLLLSLAVKALGNIPESRATRFTLMAALLIALFLWISAFFYTPSAVALLLAFFFAGMFLAASRETGVISSRSFELRNSPQHRLASATALLILTLGGAWFLWAGAEKTLAAYHFQRAVVLSNTEGAPFQEIEEHIGRALNKSADDRYYTALSRINLAKAQIAASSATGTPEENQLLFQESLSRSIAAARAAVSANPSSSENWAALGAIYSALVPEPLSVEGAYENASFAFAEARRRNPNNPLLPLLMAQLELSSGNVDGARTQIRGALALKEDYADAYIALAQLEIKEGNTAGALASAEKLSALVPDNAGVRFEIGLLKHSSKDFSGSAESFSKALELSPDYANAKYYLALSLIELGKVDEAKRHLEELLVANPDNAELKAALAELE